MESKELEMLSDLMRDWADRLGENETPKLPDKIQMRSFLEECGANLEGVRGYEESMKKWTDKGMSEAIIAIWGKDRWDSIKKWNEGGFIKDYEELTGHTLPSINVYKKGTKKKEIVGRSKQGSMKHILGLMTRWSALSSEEDSEFTESRFTEEMTVRITNGLLRLQGSSKEDLVPLQRPDTGEIYHPSLSPDYPRALVDKLLEK